MTENDEKRSIPNHVNRTSPFDIRRVLPVCSLVALGITAPFAIWAIVVGVETLPRDGPPLPIELFAWPAVMVLSLLLVNLATALIYARANWQAEEGQTIHSIMPAFIALLLSGATGTVVVVIYKIFFQKPGVEDWADFSIGVWK